MQPDWLPDIAEEEVPPPKKSSRGAATDHHLRFDLARNLERHPRPQVCVERACNDSPARLLGGQDEMDARRPSFCPRRVIRVSVS